MIKVKLGKLLGTCFLVLLIFEEVLCVPLPQLPEGNEGHEKATTPAPGSEKVVPTTGQD